MLTQMDFEKAARDPKFMASRWKQRVSVSEKRLKKSLASNMSREEKEIELRIHKNRIAKAKEWQEKNKKRS